MKCLQELKKFCVKKESVGFELSELGELADLGGELGIYNLEKVATKEESMKAKLVSKGDLKELKLVWGLRRHLKESGVLDGTTEPSDVLDGLEPHPNVRSLVIKNHRGLTGPSWLCDDISHFNAEVSPPRWCVLGHSSTFWAAIASHVTHIDSNLWACSDQTWRWCCYG